MNIFETSYTEYLRAKKSGLRREAMTALNTFLAACGNVDTASKRQIVKDFFTRQSAEDIEKAFSFPLNSQLLFPVLAEWCAENPADSWIWRSWAYLARFREYLSTAQGDILCIEDDASLDDLPIRKALCRALELDSADHLARKMYIESLLETLQLLLHDKSAGDDSAIPLIPDETNKIMGQLAQLPDIPEKTQLTERLQRMMGKI
jgi:hypothetical protein